MPSARSAATAAVYALSLAGTVLILIATCLDDDTAAVTLTAVAAALILTTNRIVTLTRYRTDGATE